MDFRIVFDRTGDEIPIVAVNPDLVEYYIDFVDQRNINRFFCISNDGTDILKHCRDLRSNIVEVNQWLDPMIGCKFLEHDEWDYLDQDQLNHIHAVWAQQHSKLYDIDRGRKKDTPWAEQIHDLYPDEVRYPMLADVLVKLGLIDRYRNINLLIHQIEDSFDYLKYQCNDGQWIEIPNTFSKDLLTHNICNFNLTFHHLGRTTFNKWRLWDLDLSHDDVNDYNEILGFVDIRLRQPQTLKPCNEYVLWCQKHGKPPIGDKLNLGNIPDLHKNLKKYRKIILNNLLGNNYFSIKHKRG